MAVGKSKGGKKKAGKAKSKKAILVAAKTSISANAKVVHGKIQTEAAAADSHQKGDRCEEEAQDNKAPCASIGERSLSPKRRVAADVAAPPSPPPLVTTAAALTAFPTSNDVPIRLSIPLVVSASGFLDDQDLFLAVKGEEEEEATKLATLPEDTGAKTGEDERDSQADRKEAAAVVVEAEVAAVVPEVGSETGKAVEAVVQKLVTLADEEEEDEIDEEEECLLGAAEDDGHHKVGGIDDYYDDGDDDDKGASAHDDAVVGAQGAVTAGETGEKQLDNKNSDSSGTSGGDSGGALPGVDVPAAVTGAAEEGKSKALPLVGCFKLIGKGVLGGRTPTTAAPASTAAIPASASASGVTGAGGRRGDDEMDGIKARKEAAAAKTKKVLAMERKAAELAEAKARAQANSVRPTIAPKRDIWEHVMSGDLDGVRGAIQRGCHPDETDDEGRTPLMIACAKGDGQLVSYFLKEVQPKASLTARAIEGWTPLMIACGANHLEIVQELVEAGADLTERDSEFGSTPLMWACGGGHVEVIKYLVEGPCSSMEHILCKNDDYWTPLMITSDGGYIDCVKLLVKAGAIVDDFSIDGRSALDLARANGNRVVEKFLEARHAVSSKDYWKAVEEGDAPRVQQLLATSGHLVDVTNGEGRTALLLACLGGHKDLVVCLVEAGAKVDFQDPSGTAPIDVAVVLGRLDLVKYLASIGGANLNLTNSKGWSPLMQAIMVADMDIIRYLVDCGAAVNTCNNDGDAVYDVAVKMNRVAIAEYLETKGAFSAKDVRKQIESVTKGERGVFKLW